MNNTNNAGAESNIEFIVRFCPKGADEWQAKYFTFESDAKRFRETCERNGVPTLKVAKVYL